MTQQDSDRMNRPSSRSFFRGANTRVMLQHSLALGGQYHADSIENQVAAEPASVRMRRWGLEPRLGERRQCAKPGHGCQPDHAAGGGTAVWRARHGRQPDRADRRAGHPQIPNSDPVVGCQRAGWHRSGEPDRVGGYVENRLPAEHVGATDAEPRDDDHTSPDNTFPGADSRDCVGDGTRPGSARADDADPTAGQFAAVPSRGRRPPAEPVSLDRPTVVDTANLKAGDTSVTLFGIDGVRGEAAQNLQGFLASAGNHVTCQAQTSADFVCLLADGTDVAQAALINGVARAKADAPDAYREQEAAAQAARRGIWAGLPPPPETVTHPTVQDTATLVADSQTYVLDGLHGLGAPYNAQMQSYIAANGDSLSCSPQDTPGHYVCVLGDGTDIAKVALVNGAAVVAPDAPDAYRAQQLEALNAHRGIWVSPPPNLMIASAPVAPPPELALVAGDDGADGITYVGGVPEAVIDGAA